MERHHSQYLIKFKLENPATKDELTDIQKCLHVELPNDLYQLLQETNGIEGEYGDFIWSASKIKTENMNMRNIVDFKDLYMPFDCLLFFADGEMVICLAILF